MKHFFSSFQVNNVNNYDNIINHDSSFQLYNLIYVVHIVLCRECDNENLSRAFFDTLHPHCLHLSHVYNYNLCTYLLILYMYQLHDHFFIIIHRNYLKQKNSISIQYISDYSLSVSEYSENCSEYSVTFINCIIIAMI